MSDSASSAPKRRRLSLSGRQEGVDNTSTVSNPDTVGGGGPSSPDAGGLVGRPSSLPTDLQDLPHKVPGNAALLHLLDGYYIKRHAFNPWNTSGGYCDVFTGDHPTFGKVAMKRPRISGDECTESQLRNFISEGQLWKRLHHPNVLQFVGMILSDSRIWLVSVFAEHGTLDKYILQHQEADRHSIVFQFISGLAYLHSNGVVHGDLKASNLLMSAHDKVLIGDFGLSKLKGMTTATSKKGAGSVRWMAPELLFAEDAGRTFSSDIYSYGITISEIIRGEPPFNQYTNDIALIKAMDGDMRPPTSPRESYEILWAAAEACWDAKPFKRPSVFDLCDRFSLDYTKKLDSAIPPLAARTDTSSGGLAELPSASSDTSPLIRDVNSNPQSVKITTLPSTIGDSRLLQLLGSAEYGDIGHMKEDGLCLTGTRIEVLERLDRWSDSDSSARVMLLKGQAGRGKSTVARSVISRFRNRWKDNASSGIFHFRRNNEALNTRSLLLLARQLASSGNQRVRAAVLKSVQDQENVAQLRLEEQFEILLVQSLGDLASYNPPRILVVIDALDECSDHSLVSALLRLLRKHATSFPSTVKFLLTSRPEEHVVGPFNASFDGVQEDLDTVDVALIDRDVRAYFTTRLSEIQQDFGFDAAWMSLEAINELVSLSQGLFQWAHAAMEYVCERPRPNLRRLVGSPTNVLGLPALYRQILSTAFPLRDDVKDDDSLSALVQHVIGSLVVAHRPMSPAVLQYLWDHRQDRPLCSHPMIEIHEDILGRLGSILRLPSSPSDPIHFMHSSVRDFFMSSDQCRDPRFLINATLHQARLANICFERMGTDLKPDICGIKDSSKCNSEVLHLVEQCISSGLRYCCRSWSTHLSATSNDGTGGFDRMHERLDEFCRKQILSWLEVLSLSDALSEVFDMVCQARQWVEGPEPPPFRVNALTITLLYDTEAFCRHFFRLMSTNAQHITLSCLLHYPNETALRTVYAHSIGPQVPRIIRGPPHEDSVWYSTVRAGSAISCVTFALDGRILAAGLANGTVRLQNMDTGELKGKPLVGHKGMVRTVAFSPDGKSLASGSDDGTIQLWTVDIGEKKGAPLVGHRKRVWSVAFSPNGKTLGSGSEDGTIRLWKVDAQGPNTTSLIIYNPRGPVLSIAFSPNGKTLASGLDEGWIRMWGVDTGKARGALLFGHMRTRITSIAFAPNGKTLASGSDDGTIRLWNLQPGARGGRGLIDQNNRVNAGIIPPYVSRPASWVDKNSTWADISNDSEEVLVGHDGAVRSIAFSPNGKTLASGSDKRIRLWNMDTRKALGAPLVGHEDLVTSVVFSPDGKSLASGSLDSTIRIWNTNTMTEKPPHPPLVGHNHSIVCVAFTSDVKTLVVTAASHIPSYRCTTWHCDLNTGESKSYGQGFNLHPHATRGPPINEPCPPMLVKSDRREPTGGTTRADRDIDTSVIRLNTTTCEVHDEGWVFINGKRCFWLPQAFYLDRKRDQIVGNTLFANFLVFHHPDIHILDVSAFL